MKTGTIDTVRAGDGARRVALDDGDVIWLSAWEAKGATLGQRVTLTYNSNGRTFGAWRIA